MAFESGITPVKSQEVIGALYIVVKDFDRSYGMQLRDYDGLLFKINPRMKHGITLDGKAELFEMAREKLKEVLSLISGGHMNPKPHEPADCPGCQWRNLCRAPHLL
jgi:CRISPR/Cas system-associated exonuclease Cas4 (RecB family)